MAHVHPIVTVYTSGPGCQACTLTKKHLDRIGVQYTEIPISSDDEITEAALELGFSTAPVVCASVGGVESSWDGYRPDRLDALAGAA